MSEKFAETTAWATGGLAYEPTEHFYPSVETTLIRKEEVRMEKARKRIQERLFHQSIQIANMLNEQSLEAPCYSDICHCVGGKAHCHLNIHKSTHTLITRQPVFYCEDCIKH